MLRLTLFAVQVQSDNGNHHRASASEVSKVKNGRPDASVHGFVRTISSVPEASRA
jgi:hypothetical protein